MILYNIYHEDSDVLSALFSIRMDDVPNSLINDLESEVALLFPTDVVPKKSKEKRSVDEISATTADENKNGGGNFPRGGSCTQGRKQGGNLTSGVGKSSVPLCYQKPAAYKII